MIIGFTDLFMTATLHRLGLIREMNPVMRIFLENGELPFILVKSLTLFLAWYALASYAKKDLGFVRTAALGGSAAYASLWLVWFLSAR